MLPISFSIKFNSVKLCGPKSLKKRMNKLFPISYALPLFPVYYCKTRASACLNICIYIFCTLGWPQWLYFSPRINPSGQLETDINKKSCHFVKKKNIHRKSTEKGPYKNQDLTDFEVDIEHRFNLLAVQWIIEISDDVASEYDTEEVRIWRGAEPGLQYTMHVRHVNQKLVE